MNSKILIVEDDQALNDAYSMILSKHGYEVQTASDGEEAIKKASEFTPDLILLDMRMPILDGLGFLEKYKKSGKKNQAKILVFSNLDSRKDVDEAFRLGADKYIVKAWASPKELVQLVSDILSSSDKIDQNNFT